MKSLTFCSPFDFSRVYLVAIMPYAGCIQISKNLWWMQLKNSSLEIHLQHLPTAGLHKVSGHRLLYQWQAQQPSQPQYVLICSVLSLFQFDNKSVFTVSQGARRVSREGKIRHHYRTLGPHQDQGQLHLVLQQRLQVHPVTLGPKHRHLCKVVS